jgi:gliding motility-associated-like protein
MTKIFTLKKATFSLIKKLMGLAVFICLQILFITQAHAQNPVVTNSATYDVFMNIDPARGLNPTNVATDISTYLTTMGAPTNSYRIVTSAVTIDPTDVAKWDVYDHYDINWYANQAAWSASPGGFNNGSIPSNWYYYSVNDASAYYNTHKTIEELLNGAVGTTWLKAGRLQSHIYPYIENGKPAMQFYGYSEMGAADFLYYPADVASTKTVKFDIDATNVITHSMSSAGFLINGGTTGTGSSKIINGYLLLFTWPAGLSTPATSLSSVSIYKLTNVNVDALHNSGGLGTFVATSSFNTFYTKSHIELSITSTTLTASIQQLDGSGNLTGSKSTMFNSQALTNTGFGGFGPFVLYSGHGCDNTSAFRYSNLEMALSSVLSGSSSLESYQYSEYLDNSPNRFFVNLTNSSAINYASSSNDMDNAYLTKIKDDKVIMITDESAGTYLPGTLNENIKNVTTEPTEATVAAALGLADLSSLSVAQKLAAKLAYLIKNTILGAYGTITTPINSAIASLYLLDGPGTDANWTGANQVNEILSWMVSGTSINIYLNPDNSINATGLVATYKLTDPGGTITTITTSTDINGKKYFAFPKASASGNYSVTLSYTPGGSITTTVPATSTFKFAPVPALDGNPSISGTMQYGQVLTLTPNITTVPGLTGTLSYQWKANGTNITGATGVTYTLTASEVGKTISCDITSNVQTGTISKTASGTVSKITISPASVTTVNSKTFNGTTATTGGAISFSGTVNSENPTSTSSIVWTSANAGTSTLNVTGISLTSLTDRYVLSVTTLSNVTPGNNATISKATPTVSVYPTAGSIIYGQMLQSSTLTTSSAVINGVSGAIAGSYAWKTSTTIPPSAGNYTTATVTFTPTVANNYNSIEFDINVTVSKAPLTVTADAKSKVYGEVNPTLTFQYSGWLNGDDAEDLTTKPHALTSVSVTTPVNVYTGGITVTGGVDENYNFSYNAADFTVTKATLSVTADAKTKVYGQANPALTFQYSGWLNGDDAEDLTTKPHTLTSVSVTSPVNVYTGGITITGGVDENYNFSYNAADFTVTKATLSVTADAKTKVYGEANPSLTFQYSGWLNGDDVEDLTTKPSASTSVSVTSAADDYIAGITVAGGVDENYDFSYNAADFTVTKAALTVTASDKSKIYGASDPVLDYTVTGTLYNGDSYSVVTGVTLSTSTASLATYGTHTIIAKDGTAVNYAITHINGTLTVSKADLIVTANDKAKVYGATDPVLDYTPSGTLYYSDSYSVITGVSLGTATGASATFGTHAITALSGTAENYNVTHVNGILTVSKAAALTVKANDKTKVYGAVDPVLNYTPSGTLYYSDDYSVISGLTLTTSTGASATFGSHTITAEGASAENYDVNNVNGILTVSKAAALTATANDKTKVYGDADPVLDYTATGVLYYDDTYAVISGVTLSAATGSSANVGSHVITAAGGSAENYDVTLQNGTLTVNKAQLTAKADNKSRIYGSVNPSFTITYDGFKYTDNINSLLVRPSVSTTATRESNAGTYDIVLTTGSDNNYEISNTNGVISIGKAELRVTANNKTRSYGQPNPALTVSYSGFVNGDDMDKIDIKPTASTSAGLNTDAGKYAITAENGSDNNYTFTYVNGTLEIIKADQILTFEAIPSGLRMTQQHDLVASSTSGLPVSFESSELSIAEISGTNMSVLKEGTVVITAIQDGNQNWNPAVNLSQTIVMLPTFDNIGSLFTPNNDGMNDYWYIPDIDQYGSISVQIYNRFGKLLYHSSAYKNDWEGTYNGSPLPEGSYYYIIKSSSKGLIKGVVNLVR